MYTSRYSPHSKSVTELPPLTRRSQNQYYSPLVSKRYDEAAEEEVQQGKIHERLEIEKYEISLIVQYSLIILFRMRIHRFLMKCLKRYRSSSV